MKKTECHIITLKFPFKDNESFFRAELNDLSKKFETIHIYPISSTNNGQFNYPKNVIINDALFNKKSYSCLKIILQNFILFTKLMFSELFRNKKISLNYFSYLKNNFCETVSNSNVFIKQIKDLENSCFYSYWLEDPAKILAVLKYKNKISSFTSRAHGFDLYEYRSKYNRHAFKKFIIKQTSHIATVSRDGQAYLQKSFPKFKSKIKCIHLGTKAGNITEYKSNKNTYTIVSCSLVIPLKRVDKIFELLNAYNHPINWTHFGEGFGFKSLIEQVDLKKKKHLKTNFKGYVNHDVIIDFYTKNKVDLFINLSQFEGLPVSIMEAMSFGIPILATDVGGTKESISTNSKLVNLSSSTQELLIDLKSILKYKPNENLRMEVLNMWDDKFNSSKNTDSLIKLLKE